MADVLRQVGAALPFVGAALAILGGLIGLRLVNGGAMRGRADRGAAAVTGLALALVAGGITAVFTAGIASSFGGSFIAALPTGAAVFGLPVGAIVFGSATAGYAVAARLRPAGNAAAGALLGPIVLGGICLTGVGLVGAGNQMAADASFEEYVDEVQARSTALHMTVHEVTATVDDKGLVASVHMRLQLASDAGFGFEQLPGKLTYPLFTLSPDDGRDPNTQIQVEAPPGSPEGIDAGGEATYDLTFDMTAGTPVQSQPGDWLLQVRFTATDGLAYGVDEPVSVRP